MGGVRARESPGEGEGLACIVEVGCSEGVGMRYHALLLGRGTFAWAAVAVGGVVAGSMAAMMAARCVDVRFPWAQPWAERCALRLLLGLWGG
jgi:hypothetical protein